MDQPQLTGKLIKSALFGAFTSIVTLTLSIFLLYKLGVLEVSVKATSPIEVIYIWVVQNVGYALIPFLCLVALYFHSLKKLSEALNQLEADRVVHLEHQVDVWVSLYFGVGVIWTTIGLRAALIAALGDLTAESAAELGAFGLLERLVDGGILLALSTTIIGGIGGYAMRLIKSVLLGSKLRRYYFMRQNQFFDPLLEKLAEQQQAFEQSVHEVIRKSQKEGPVK